MTRESISPKLKKSVLERDKYRCRYCGTNEPPFHLDHVYPVKKGGETSKANLVVSCVKCNQKKHTSLEWPPPVGYFDLIARLPSPTLNKLIVRLFLSNILGWGGISISIPGLYALSLGGSDPLWKIGLYLLSIGPSIAYFGYFAMCSSRDALIDYYKSMDS